MSLEKILSEIKGKTHEANFASFDASKVKIGPLGEMIVRAKIMQPGWTSYQLADGTKYKTHMSADDLNQAVTTCNKKPVTNRHPAGLVNPKNWVGSTKGMTGETASFDGRWLENDLSIADETTQKDSINFPAVSAGYTWKMKSYTVQPPTWNADTQSMDEDVLLIHIQDIKINHVATAVRNPRSKGAGISFDEEGNKIPFDKNSDLIPALGFSADEDKTPTHEEKHMDDKIITRELRGFKIGGNNFDEVDVIFPESARTGVQPLLKRAEDLENALRTTQNSLDEATGQNKVLTAEKEKLEASTKDMIPKENLDEEVTKLVALKEQVNMWDAFAEAEGCNMDEFKETEPAARLLSLQKVVISKNHPNVTFDEKHISGAAMGLEAILKERHKNSNHILAGIAAGDALKSGPPEEFQSKDEQQPKKGKKSLLERALTS